MAGLDGPAAASGRGAGMKAVRQLGRRLARRGVRGRFGGAAAAADRRWDAAGAAASAEMRRALRPLAARVRTRWLAEAARSWLLVAASGTALAALAGRLLGREEWPAAAAGWALVALVGAAAGALRAGRWPGGWAVARAADGLGLAERVTSALHARAVGHAAAPLVEADALRRLGRVDAREYPLLERPAAWRPVGLALLALALALVAPLPTLDRSAADRPALAQARRSVAALPAKAPAPEPLAGVTADELAALEERLAAARSTGEAARALEQAQERLALLPMAEDYATRRALEELAASWEGRADPSASLRAGPSTGSGRALRDAARALRSTDGAAVERALSELAERAAAMGPEEARALARALQAGANATRDLPELTAALRQAAAQASAAAAPSGGTGSAGPGGAERLEEAIGDLGPRLGGAAARAAGLRRLEQALSGLGQARAELGRTGEPATGRRGDGASGRRGDGATGRAGDGATGETGSAGAAGGSGSSTGAGTGDGTGAGRGSASGAGAGSGGPAGTTSPDGAAGQAGTGPGSGASAGSGTGAGTGAGAGSGSGAASGSGAGTGGGAGAGASGGAGAGGAG
ncbi:MAG TPA: hypothetical protein VG370_14130, partial [Chloroflexota bacterium]|nr:hypothetical protein [Chloroflexota bacterium]